jgi:hypothetical protein
MSGAPRGKGKFNKVCYTAIIQQTKHSSAHAPSFCLLHVTNLTTPRPNEELPASSQTETPSTDPLKKSRSSESKAKAATTLAPTLDPTQTQTQMMALVKLSQRVQLESPLRQSTETRTGRLSRLERWKSKSPLRNSRRQIQTELPQRT